MIYILDTADIEEIRYCNEFYPVSGVTTNPTIISKEHDDFWKIVKEIRAIIGPDKMLHVQTTQKKAEDTTKSLSESKKANKTNAEKTAEEKVMNNLQKIEKAIVAFDTKTMLNRIRALDEKTQQTIIKRIGECCDQMTDIYNRLGDKS